MEMEKGMMGKLDREQRQIVPRLGFREGEQSEVARAFTPARPVIGQRCVDARC